MWKFSGQINGSVYSIAQSLPMVIQNFTLVNMTGATVACDVYLMKDSRTVLIAPLGASINAGAIYTDEIPRLMESGEVVRLATNGLVSYLFNIENTQSP